MSAHVLNAFEEEFRDQKILKRWVLVIHKDGSGIEAVVRDNSTFTEDFGMFKACLALYAWERANDNYKAGEPVRVLGNIFSSERANDAFAAGNPVEVLGPLNHAIAKPAQREKNIVADDCPFA